MADVHDRSVRSKNMAAIRSRDTKPELIVRRGLHAMGYRYRLHRKTLPGTPDMVFPKFRAVLFVHGCFWHWHDCSMFKLPGTRMEFWEEKLSANKLKDSRDSSLLKEAHWRIAVVWECTLRGKTGLSGDKVIQLVSEWITSSEQTIEL